MEYEIDVRKVEEEYEKYIQKLSESEEGLKNMKYFLVKDEFGNSLSPSLFIQLITSLCDKQLQNK